MKTEPTLDEHTAAHVAELFRAFSDTRRVRIMAVPMCGEANVSALSRAACTRESAVSHPMRGLRQMRLVSAHKAGKEVYYRVDDPHSVRLFQQGVKHIQDKQGAEAGWRAAGHVPAAAGPPIRRLRGR
jgi:ArsR family transcriptional regulator, lead/cadmium/zinc/bismuth-responsive transcriptional repressor